MAKYVREKVHGNEYTGNRFHGDRRAIDAGDSCDNFTNPKSTPVSSHL